MYERFFKRVLDIICAALTLIVFCWLYVIIAVLVRIKIGSPVIFKQSRPGIKDENGQEKLFKIFKFRTMKNIKDKDGNLLSDEIRLTKFGAWLRSTSLDELPQAINILKGDMSVVGPRPHLVRDMVFMTDKQRQRHNVRPGLTGLAQMMGRNAFSWDDKLEIDIEYLEHITFANDLKIVFKTVPKFIKRENINAEGMVTVDYYGNYLLREGKVSQEEYLMKLGEARDLISI